MTIINIRSAVISSIIVWIIGVTAFMTSYSISIFEDPDVQANRVLSFMIIPAAFFGAHLYYRKGYLTNGWVLGVFMILVTIILDAIITVPVLIIPEGGNHLSFFTDPGFWLIALEYIGVVIIYWFIKKTYQMKAGIKT